MHASNPFRAGDYVQEGVNPAAGVLALACTVSDDGDRPRNRILLLRNDRWLDFTSSGEAVLSIDADAHGAAYVLGEHGTVIEFSWHAGTQEELRASRRLHINGATADLGPLRRLRVLGASVLCGGSEGQLYALEASVFVALPRLRWRGEAQTIEDLAGTSASDVVAVTTEGRGAWFDGSSWHDLEVPTTASLTSVCRVSADRFVLVGKAGTIVTGGRDGWRAVDATNPTRNYWGVAERAGVVYAAHLGGIDVLDDDHLRVLAIPDAAQLEFTVLRNGPDGVWSFAGKTIGVVDADGFRTAVAG